MLNPGSECNALFQQIVEDNLALVMSLFSLCQGTKSGSHLPGQLVGGGERKGIVTTVGMPSRYTLVEQ